MEHEQPARPDKPPDLREHSASHLIGKQVQGDVGHDRIEAPVRERKPQGHVGCQEPGHRPEAGLRLPDGLVRHVDRGDRVALVGQPGGIVAGPAPQLQDGAHVRLPQRDQERHGPQARPVQVIAGLPALPEELVPELSTRIGHPATLCRTRLLKGFRSPRALKIRLPPASATLASKPPPSPRHPARKSQPCCQCTGHRAVPGHDR
jgi:hypothetical protein